ncbi:OPT family oligopeptide transporter [Fimbriiglobus ruber]|uniref:Oligopeptide transporter, OPT family n=1 Tax=Fimbriiglobus ruber TaxID=1908690 RepID=A0A225E7T4_9BACT|nr:OPT/YSL family transporter [Fimbriiglobus ruber]OWK44487.1 oligopeptide transporter, OPT family [Fimbriiglobus ruber]
MSAPPDQPVAFRPFVPDDESPPEFTLAPVVIGALLGIVFGASSIYLVLKVGLTISASIPVAVLAITLFRLFSRVLGLRRATILENNIVQTTGSAGESIAFGVGLVMPALLVLGFDIHVVRVMTVGVLGGLLGILMMIPLRRAFVVKKHGELKYPEGTACAEVLIAGEKGGSTAQMLFVGFGFGFVFQFLMQAFKLFREVAEKNLFTTTPAGATVGLKGGVLGCEMSAPLLGVGYIIGPRIACIMAAGGVLAYLVLVPTIVYFGDSLDHALAPAKMQVADVNPLGALAGGAAAASQQTADKGLIKNMSVSAIRQEYVLYIGAGAVAAGGIISMIQALPVIFGSVIAGFRDLRASRGAADNGAASVVPRTERDLSMKVVVFGSLGLVVALAAAPQFGLGLNPAGIAGAVMILLFGFLFVTVSSRLTGEIGSSSNPISGMTVATLLLTCLILLALGEFGVIAISKEVKLLALTIAGVVCIASSNGGTTSQALKTGYLVGATPRAQQYAILVGSLTSALVVGLVLILLNQAGTVYSKKNLPSVRVDVSQLTATDHVRSGEYADDATTYHVLNIGKEETPDAALFVATPGHQADVPPGRYLVAADGTITYLCDPAVNGKLAYQDSEADKPDGERRTVKKFEAPKTQLMALIINGILDRKLPWGLVLIGVLIALTLELSGVPSLPFAVGVYLPISSSTPIFLGGALRWLVDKIRRSPDGGDSSPGVLLSSGYIAGGSIAALLAAFLEFAPKEVKDALDFGEQLKGSEAVTRALGGPWPDSNLPVTLAFGVLIVVLVLVGSERFGKKNGVA